MKILVCIPYNCYSSSFGDMNTDEELFAMWENYKLLFGVTGPVLSILAFVSYYCKYEKHFDPKFRGCACCFNQIPIEKAIDYILRRVELVDSYLSVAETIYHYNKFIQCLETGVFHETIIGMIVFCTVQATRFYLLESDKLNFGKKVDTKDIVRNLEGQFGIRNRTYNLQRETTPLFLDMVVKYFQTLCQIKILH